MALRSAILGLALAAALCGSAAGCSSTEVLRGLPPFIESLYDEKNDTTDVVVRPLFRYEDRPEVPATHERERRDVHYLFPLGHWKKRGDDVEHHLYPLFQWIERKEDDGFVTLSYLFFPFVIGGTDATDGTYFSLWPLGGTLKGLLGKDYVLHILFPLFSYSRLHTWESYNVLFPFIAWHTGEGNEGLRILPFYGHQRKVDRTTGELISDRYSVLFPFFSWAKDNQNGTNPFTSFVLFPVYGQTRSALCDETNVLWPLFRLRDEKKEGVRRWRAPFPLVMIATGSEVEYDFWPIVGYRNRGDFHRWFAFWPIVREETYAWHDVTERRAWFLPLFWNWERKDRRTGEIVYAQRKVWPLVRFDRGKGGAFGVRVLSPTWFIDSPDGTFETLLSPLVEILRYQDDPERGRELRLLFSAFRARWGAKSVREEEGWSFLGGLVGHRTTREGDGLVRLFWFFEV